MRRSTLAAAVALAALTLSAALADDAPAATKWSRIWSDAFGGPVGSPPDPRNWSYDRGGWGWGNGELQTYTARRENVAMDGNGHLVITALRERYTGSGGVTRDYTSGRLKTWNLFSVRYGRVAARVKVPEGQGLWPTFWMLGDDAYSAGWPDCGEVDILEIRGQEPSILHGTVHGPGSEGSFGPGGRIDVGYSLADRYHIYEVRWNRRAIRFLLDGRRYAAVRRKHFPRSAEWVYDHNMFLLLNLAVGSNGWAGYPDETTPFPARLKADWVRVWKRRR